MLVTEARGTGSAIMASTNNIQSKSDLAGVLVSLRAGAIYDLFGQIHLHNFFKEIAAGRANGNELIAELPEGKMTLSEFADKLNAMSGHALLETKRNANRALTRNLFKETVRLTRSYYESSSQTGELKANDWYEFARFVSNSLSHDFRLNFNKHDRDRLPVSYHGVTIDEGMDGEPLSMQLEILIRLVDEIIGFVETSASSEGVIVYP